MQIIYAIELHQKPKSNCQKPFSAAHLKIIGNFDLPNASTRFTFKSKKIQLKKIGAVLLFQTVMTGTKRNKIHTSL